ncbi:hypothetical protein B566_EDAN015262 [Ephemera danica]|nr:hypothetical protein B566_EDAN015262 [Ephemera danica]
MLLTTTAAQLNLPSLSNLRNVLKLNDVIHVLLLFSISYICLFVGIVNVGYDCPECYKTFLHKQMLYIHQRTSCDKKKLQCVICMRRFISAFLLKKHQEN